MKDDEIKLGQCYSVQHAEGHWYTVRIDKRSKYAEHYYDIHGDEYCCDDLYTPAQVEQLRRE